MKKIFAIISIAITTVSCSKFVDTQAPDSSLDAGKVFEKDNSAVGAVNAIMSDLGSPYSALQGSRGVSVVSGLVGDELNTVSALADYIEIYSNSILGSNPITANIWSALYADIYKANAVVEGATASSTLTPAIRSQIIGEARFLRAFMYFYLVNMYGAVPLIISTDYEQNKTAVRTDVTAVYDQMITDLKAADSLLSNTYRNQLGTVVTQRFRPNKYAAEALLARVYLYTGQWTDAEAAASLVLSQGSVYKLTPNLGDLFRQPANMEVLWNFAPYSTTAGVISLFTGDGGHYNPGVLKAYGLGPQTFGYDLSNYLSDSIVNEFEPADKRKAEWLESVTADGKTYYFPNKYKTDALGVANVQEYTVVLRLAEVYLIRAEARIRQDHLDDAFKDINQIRSRAGLNDTTALSEETAMRVLEHEKKMELFTEWGHRWFDLKRWPGRNSPDKSRAEEVMNAVTPLKGGNWNKNWLLLPLPQTDIINDPFLKQNNGYF